MKKIIFMGKSGSGKTTLCQRLHDIEVSYRKTQAVEHYEKAVDTPGEYLENRGWYSALITTSAEAEIIAVVADPLESENYIPPAFAMTFGKPVIGIVTKICSATKTQTEKAKETLQKAGIKKIFLLDSIEGTGLKELFSYLREDSDDR